MKEGSKVEGIERMMDMLSTYLYLLKIIMIRILLIRKTLDRPFPTGLRVVSVNSLLMTGINVGPCWYVWLRPRENPDVSFCHTGTFPYTNLL